MQIITVGIIIGMAIMGKLLDKFLFGNVFNELSQDISDEMREWSLDVIRETGPAAIAGLLILAITVIAIIAASFAKWGYMF